MLVINQIIGGAKGDLVGIAPIDAIMAITENEKFNNWNWLHGTWSAVLLTPLSVAGDYRLGEKELLYGRDYVDLIFVSTARICRGFFGYVRL